MEMLLVGLVALVAFAAVLFPLFRRKVGAGDEREFENVPPAHNVTSTVRPGIDTSATPAPAAPNAAKAAGTGHGAGGVPDAGAAAHAAGAGGSDRDVEAEVLRYRAAVRAGTVCRKCGQANPAASVYCYECGERLPLADAKEFE